MKYQEWTFIDKTKWPDKGEWTNEPDKIQFTDEATGLPCLIVRAHGHLCGYVGVSEGHPAFKKDYNHFDVSVHGGLTFANMCQPIPEKLPAGRDPEQRVCHTPEPGEPDHVWWLGFDCAHSGDYCPQYFESTINMPQFSRHESYKNIAYVKEECRSLAAQLKEMENA